MEIDLPVHEPARYQEFFDRIDRFFFHHEIAFINRQHFQDTVITDDSLRDPGEKTIAGEVVHSVHIQLTGYQRVKIRLWVFVHKDPDRRLQPATELLVESLHNGQRQLLVIDTADQYVLQRMGIRPMSDIVKQDRHFYAQLLLLIDLHS